MILQAILLTALAALGHASSCGETPIEPALNNFIVGGVEARPNSIPWQISLGAQFWGLDEGHICGGSIINERYIVTAAHCFFPRMKYYIRAGAHALSKRGSSRGAPDQKVKVEKVIIHEGYHNREGLHDDIALLRLASPLKFRDEIQPICLPEPKTKWADKESFLVTGWGQLGEYDDSPDRLRQVVVPHIPNSVCRRQPNYGGGAIHEGVMCAGLILGGKDACAGDSGGPLATVVDGKWTLAGVVSWGVGCGDKHSPGVYTNVGQYVDWINKHMKL